MNKTRLEKKTNKILSFNKFIDVEEKYCLFLGAGFSKWAINLPTALELFDFNIKIWGPRERDKLSKIRTIHEKWIATHPNGNSEEFITLLMDTSSQTKKLVIWYIARRLTDPFIEKDKFFELYSEFYPEIKGRRVMTIDEKRKDNLEGIRKARCFIDSLSGPYFEGIITTNYDLLIEYALGTKNFCYGDRPRKLYGPRRGYYIISFKRQPVFLKGSLPIIKLHGSISLTEKGYCTDGRGGITGKALVIPPTHNKKISDLLNLEWNGARKILKNSGKIIIFGFAFNQYDQELCSLLEETEQWISKIIIINTNSNAKIKAKKIWPSANILLIHPEQLPFIPI